MFPHVLIIRGPRLNTLEVFGGQGPVPSDQTSHTLFIQGCQLRLLLQSPGLSQQTLDIGEAGIFALQSLEDIDSGLPPPRRKMLFSFIIHGSQSGMYLFAGIDQSIGSILVITVNLDDLFQIADSLRPVFGLYSFEGNLRQFIQFLLRFGRFQTRRGITEIRSVTHYP